MLQKITNRKTFIIVVILLVISTITFYGYRYFWPQKISLETFPQNITVTDANSKEINIKDSVIYLRKGDYRLSISAEGYKNRVVSVAVNSENKSKSIALEPSSKPSSVYNNPQAQKILRNDDLQNNGFYKKLPFTTTVSSTDINFFECKSVRFGTKAICYESLKRYSTEDIQKIIANLGHYSRASIYDTYAVQNGSTLVYQDDSSDIYFIDDKIIARTTVSKNEVVNFLQDNNINPNKYQIKILPKYIIDDGTTE